MFDFRSKESKKKLNPKEQLREWTKGLRHEKRGLERQLRSKSTPTHSHKAPFLFPPLSCERDVKRGSSCRRVLCAREGRELMPTLGGDYLQRLRGRRTK